MKTMFPLLFASLASAVWAAAPNFDPAAELKLPWTDELKWSQVVDITTVAGADIDAKLATAQQELAAKGGGVVYFPAGEYRFKESVKLMDGIILRGAPPTGESDARSQTYQLGSRLEFPKFEFKANGDGTPIDIAFKSIEVADPAKTSNCGVVHLAINRGHIKFAEGEGFVCGKNRLVLGCILRNTAYADPGIPDSKIGQPAWQRYTYRFGAAIDIKSAENLLIANNRVAKSGEENFTINGFVVLDRKKEKATLDGVVFDYDNRPGIYANHQNIGGPGGQGPDGTPETHPHGFRKGTVIANNAIFSTGRCAIGFCGDGVQCTGNLIRIAKDVWRASATGRDMTSGTSTNDNRAVEMRGWRWNVSDNDYDVHRNWAYDKKYLINDGEGLMHEDHANSTIKDSILRNNQGNTYLSLYKTAGIDGLIVEGNKVPNIMVVADRNVERFPIRNVRIENNTVTGGKSGTHVDKGSIRVAGEPAEHVVVKNNRFDGDGEAVIINQANAKLEGNRGFREEKPPVVLKKK